MSVFISYSTKDSDFAEKLSFHLIQKRINIWLDKWVMQPGDSLIDKIQTGLTDSSFLLVVLSNNSVESEWCRKELNSGLMRELEEKRVIVIPILIDDCKIPLLLKEKVYADFRNNFEEGLNSLLRPLQKLFSEHMGRIKNDDIITDFAINWGLDKITKKFVLEIDAVNWYQKDNKTVLLQIKVTGNEKATKRFILQYQNGLPNLMIDSILLLMKVDNSFKDLNILIQNDKVDPYLFKINDSALDIGFEVIIRGVLLGEDNGLDLVINLIDFMEMLSLYK